ncbi:MAG TPA: DNA cytosine methyltransferase [archaeon]|nr:DNA cytosine methyltransferase [archaeon]
MNVLSLFDGISCGRVALEKAGFKINKYYSSEIDKYAIAIAKYHYPDNIELGDIRNISGKDLKNIDLLIGGSPCNNFSFAGKKEGMITEDNKEITTLDQYLDLKKKDLNLKVNLIFFGNILEYYRKLNLNFFY